MRRGGASLDDLVVTRCARWTGGNRQVTPAERGGWMGAGREKMRGGGGW